MRTALLLKECVSVVSAARCSMLQHRTLHGMSICSPSAWRSGGSSLPSILAHRLGSNSSASSSCSSGLRRCYSPRSARAPLVTRAQAEAVQLQRAQQALQHLAVTPQQYAKGRAMQDSVVKIYTVYSRPDRFLPWQNHPKRESTGTGFVIRDRLILTNAHVVADQTYVTLKRHGSGTKCRADVVAVAHECDLALLTVHDDTFWQGEQGPMLPLQLGEVPALQEAVLVCGFPTGGDNSSITSGVVSRCEVTQYVHAASHLPAIQIDAAINAGDVVVGVAFQNLPSADSIGYIIPTTVVNRFLSEVMQHGQYNGFCSLGIVFQTMDNIHLREAFQMGPSDTGVLINTVQPTAPAAKVLQKGDVLMEFDGVKIANDATVHFRHRERIFFTSLITLKATGSTCRVKVLREGRPLEFEITLAPLSTLVPVHQYDKLPSFYVYAGLVFVPLTQPYLHEYGDDWMSSSPRRLVDKALNSLMRKPGQQIVILSQVLVDESNTGYQSFQNLQVHRVNGVEVLNLKHLKELLEDTSSNSSNGNGRVPGGEAFVRLELEDDRVIVLNRRAAAEATEAILLRYRVAARMSADLLEGQ